MDCRCFSRRNAGAVLVAFLMIVAACSPSATATQDQKQAEAAVEFSPTMEFVQAAAARVEATPHRFENSGRVVPGDGTAGSAISGGMDGQFDGTVFAFTAEFSDGEVFRTIYEGSHVYRLGIDFGFDDIAADTWTVFDAAVVFPDQPLTNPFVSVGDLSALGTPDTIVEGPSSTVRGVETRTIQITFSNVLDRVAENFSDDELDSSDFEELADVGAQATVHVDGNGVVRRFTIAADDIETNTDYFDFDAGDIVIEIPEAVDVTELLLERLGS